jgi:hypothetical protein
MSAFTHTGFNVRAQLHNSALPAANTNLISDVSPTGTASGATQFRIYAHVSIAGDLNLKRTRSAVTNTERLASFTTTSPAATVDILVDQGETINLQFSATAGTVHKLTDFVLVLFS